MPSDKPRLATYTTNSTIKKFQYISNYEKRSASKELEYIVEEYIKSFESKHGELVINEDGNITISKSQLISELSTSKIG